MMTRLDSTLQLLRQYSSENIIFYGCYRDRLKINEFGCILNVRRFGNHVNNSPSDSDRKHLKIAEHHTYILLYFSKGMAFAASIPLISCQY